MKVSALGGVALALCTSLWSAGAASQSFPEKPITMIVPYAAGGSADVIARVLAKQLGEELTQNVLVELKPGAGSMIGSEYVAKAAKPDGYTILLGANPLAINLSLMKLGFDPAKDLVPIAGIVGFPSIVVTSAASPYRSVADVLKAAKAGHLTYGSSGPGSHSHMSGELFQVLTGTQMTHIPYKGSGAVYPDLIAGRVTLLFDVAASAVGFLKGGQVRALAVTSKDRSKAVPGVPTLIEEGVDGYESLTWFGMFAPKNTPQPVVKRLEQALNKVVYSPEFVARLEQWGGLPLPNVRTSEDFGRFFHEDIQRWASLVRSGRIRPLE